MDSARKIDTDRVPAAPQRRPMRTAPDEGDPQSPGAIISSPGSKHGAITGAVVPAGERRRVLSPGGRERNSDANRRARAPMIPGPATGQVAPPPGGLIVTGAQGQRLAARVCARLMDSRQWGRTQLLLDIVVLYVASSFALFADTPVRIVTSNRWLAALFPLVLVGMMRARRSPDERLNVSILETVTYVLGVVSLAAMLMISLVTLVGGSDPIGLAPRLWLFSVVYLGIERATLVSIRREALRTHRLTTPTLVVGAGMMGTHIVKRLLSDPGYGLRPIGFVDSDPLPSPEPGATPTVPILGGPEELSEAIARSGARHVILAFSGERDHVLIEKVRECEALGVGVSLVPRMYETVNERTTLDHVGGIPLLTLHPVDPRGWQFAIKHALDRTIALAGVLVASPLLIAIAAGVRLSSPGPILFRQRRVGRDGREFDLLKFRTMRLPDDGGGSFDLPPGVAPGGVEGVDRRTPIGRVLRELSLDELPQLINVLRGDMSIVGPRPERPEYVARFARDVARYEDRHRVKSGITGWAQVNGLRGQTSIADRVEWDNHYIRNWSLRLDLRIMALTVAEVLRFREHR